MQRGDAERRGFKPYGLGSVRTHLYGRASEIAVAQFLGAELDTDWTWEADKRRGCDIQWGDTPVHVRSSRTGDGFLFRELKDSRRGIWVYCDTSRYPVIVLAGWLTGSQAYLVSGSGTVSREWLRPLPIVNVDIPANALAA